MTRIVLVRHGETEWNKVNASGDELMFRSMKPVSPKRI